MRLDIGLIQVYTGNGKGKTTAALGLALRAVGAGLRLYIGQFVKGSDCSELHALHLLGDKVVINQFGNGFIANSVHKERHIQSARAGLLKIESILRSGEYDLVILDEANVAVHYGLFSIEELIELIDSKSAHTEIVITGRHAHQMLLDRADLVTRMDDVKHYYASGISARTGIEK